MAITLNGSNGVTTNNGKVEVRNSDYSNGLLLNRDLDVASVGAAGVQMKYGAIYNGSDVYPVVTMGVVDTDGTAGWWEVRHDDSSKFKVDSAGRVTMPYQPAFSVAKTDGDQANTNPISFNVIDVNIGGHWNGTRFTAPVAGTYYFSASLLTANGGVLNYNLKVNGSMYRSTEYTTPSSNFKPVGLFCFVPMAAGDYVELNSNNYSVYGGGGNYSMFNGYLIG